MGLASIYPDRTGYGASHGLVPSDLVKKSAVTSSLPLFEKAKSIVYSLLGGMTSIGNEAYYMGYSGGGYNSIAASDGLMQLGVNPVKILVGGAPIKLRSVQTMTQTFAHVTYGLAPIYFLLLFHSAMPLSDTRPDVSNFGVNQSFLQPEDLRGDLLELFKDLNAPSPNDPSFVSPVGHIAQNYPQLSIALAMIGQLFVDERFAAFVVEAVGNGDSDPCVNNPQAAIIYGVDKICEALDDNDLTDEELNAPDDIIEICHGTQDVFVP